MPASLTVIVGCMFSGKSEELLRRIKRARIAQRQTIIYKPARDTRTAAEVRSRDGRTEEAIVVANARGILPRAFAFDTIGIDEAQFFDEEIVRVVGQLYGAGKRVIVAGLDTDYLGKPFGPMPLLLAIPEADVVKLIGVCMRCGDNATRSHRTVDSTAQVDVGDVEKYEALCYPCYHGARDERTNETRVPATAAATASA